MTKGVWKLSFGGRGNVTSCFPSALAGRSSQDNGHPRWPHVPAVWATLGTARWDLSRGNAAGVTLQFIKTDTANAKGHVNVFLFLLLSFPAPLLSPLLAKINEIVMATYRVMKTKLPSTLQSMSLYLANRDTEFILFKPVRVGFSSAPPFVACAMYSAQICLFVSPC